MAITSSQIQEAILNCLRSGTSRTTREIKHHLETAGIRDYTPGQFSGSINTLCRQKNIKCVSRGTYRIMSPGDRPEKKVCFVVSPIGDDGSPNPSLVLAWNIAKVFDVPIEKIFTVEN